MPLLITERGHDKSAKDSDKKAETENKMSGATPTLYQINE